MKKRIVFWIIGCLIGSIIYACIFRYRIISKPDFIVSTKDLLMYMAVFFFISTVLSLPVLLFLVLRKLWTHQNDQLHVIKLNIIFLIGSVVYLSLLQVIFFKNLQDTIDLILSYGITFLIIINIVLFTKSNYYRKPQ